MNDEMVGLKDVDYSDIQAEFDRLAMPSSSYLEEMCSANYIMHVPYKTKDSNPGYGFLGMRNQSGDTVGQVMRAEYKAYGYHAPAHPRKRPMNRYGEGRVAKGFVDALHSVVKDVDVYDPANEMNIFLKYMFIRADFIGGQCHHCKSPNARIVNVYGEKGFIYEYACSQCGLRFKPKAGAIFHKCRYPMSMLMDAVRMSLDLRGVSVRYMAKRFSVMPNTAHALQKLIRNNSLLADRWPNEHEGESVQHLGHKAKPIKLYSLADLASIAQ